MHHLHTFTFRESERISAELLDFVDEFKIVDVILKPFAIT